jgi:hypothetical protein
MIQMRRTRRITWDKTAAHLRWHDRGLQIRDEISSLGGSGIPKALHAEKNRTGSRTQQVRKAEEDKALGMTKTALLYVRLVRQRSGNNFHFFLLYLNIYHYLIYFYIK